MLTSLLSNNFASKFLTNSFQQTHGFEILRFRLLDQELRFAVEEFGFWEIL